MVEEPWGYTADWNRCAFDADDVWVRGLLDLYRILEGDIGAPIAMHGYDWKTGKRYPPKHLQQEQLYAVFAFSRFPSLQEFNFSFVYLDEGKPWDSVCTLRTYHRERANILRDTFTRRGIRMTTDITFRPNPAKVNCVYCDYKTSCEWAVK